MTYTLDIDSSFMNRSHSAPPQALKSVELSVVGSRECPIRRDWTAEDHLRIATSVTGLKRDGGEVVYWLNGESRKRLSTSERTFRACAKLDWA